ncbi:MAG: protein kinase, partial [Myxococcales bacterium]|nr:protein kinase [Myxococcales bacterium]
MTDPRQATRDRTGQTLGPYRVLRLLGAGGMGRVYLAEDTTLGRAVALKVLNDDVVRDWAARLRFLREAQAASAVLHPSVAAVYAIHEADDAVFIAMEFVEGRTLRSFLEARGGPLALREALRIARDVAHALCHAHAAGVVHRDLKPENLMLDPQGQVKILDFGLAKQAGPGGDVQHASTLSFATADGVILGTPSYMAPEQIHGKATDARADIFSVGVILYEMATGARPFRGASTMEVLIATARDELTPASQHNPQVPPALDRLLARCLAKAPADRFPDSPTLAAALDELLLAEVEVELHGALASDVIPGRGYLGEILPPRLLRGRDLESSALLDAVARAAEGGAHLVLIHGEAGVGKSALLSSLRDPISRFDARLGRSAHPAAHSGRADPDNPDTEPDTSITLADRPGLTLSDFPALTLSDLPGRPLATGAPTPRPGHATTTAPAGPAPAVTRFISGKFDRNSEGAPLAPLAQALGALVRQAAASELASRWRIDLAEATGPNRHVLDDMVPELRRLLGESPPEAHAAYHPDHGAEARNRFHASFQRVVRLFAARHPPLVLALDDLHLADPAALELLEILLSDPAGGQLLVLATYRDGELGDDAHPLVLTLDRLRRIGVPVDELALSPLLPHEATQLVADALGCDLEEAAPLAERLHPHARGNPALLRHLLLGLRRENQLRFDSSARRWHWDESETSAAIVSGDVATLVAARLQRLAPGVQRVLAIAALAGRPVDLNLLSAVDRRGPLATTEDLREALREGLLVASDAALHSLQRNPDPAEPGEAERRTYQPPHDGILQAARNLLDPDTRAELHLQLGRTLLHRHRPGDDDLFALVDHLGRGAAHITDPDELERLARLHLEASRRARNATAYAAAVRHARAGLDALAAALVLAPDHGVDATVRPDAVRQRYPAHVFQLEREWMHAEAMRGELASADRL